MTTPPAHPTDSGAQRKVIECPRCDKGTVKRRTGDLWWQVQHLRCSWCRGTGRVYAEASDG